jgi:hypothetical protein
MQNPNTHPHERAATVEAVAGLALPFLWLDGVVVLLSRISKAFMGYDCLSFSKAKKSVVRSSPRGS